MIKHAAHIMNTHWLASASGDHSINTSVVNKTAAVNNPDFKKMVGIRKSEKIKTYLQVLNKSVSQRQDVEQFIKSQYRHHFEAHLLRFFPVILTVYCQKTQQLLGALGIRYADQDALFSEQYLTAPIEQLIASKNKTQVQRKDIIELGHFAVSKPHYLAPVIKAVAGFIRQLDAQWSVYTLSAPIKKAFDKIAIETTFLAKADISQLKADYNGWGKYYHKLPAVYYSHIQTAMCSDESMENSVESA